MEKKKPASPSAELTAEKIEREECFVIMPFSDQGGYDSGHFSRVYEDIFKPACAAAGYIAIRGDDVKQSNLIHLDILKRVVHSPMAICDLSSRNPNVLFELGLRQAFDKPTVLVKDEETPDIFDIAPIRYTPYRRALRYREVLFDQQAIAEALRSTRDAGGTHNVNSLIRLLELSAPANITKEAAADPSEYFQIVMAELSRLRREVRTIAEISVRGPDGTQSPPIADRVGLPKVDRVIRSVDAIFEKIKAGVLVEDVKKDIGITLAIADDAAEFYRVRGDDAKMDAVLNYVQKLRHLFPP